MKLLIRVLVGALSLLLVAEFIPGIQVDDIYTAIIAAIILGFLNLLVKPILILLTLPITILTLGLFMFVINASLFIFAASFIEGFTVDSFFSAIIGSLAVSVFNAIGNSIVS